MQVLFESRDPQAASLRDLAVHRLQLVLRRLRLLVSRARLRLSDINGPRGGVDKRCQVELATDSAGTLVISATARDWRPRRVLTRTGCSTRWRTRRRLMRVRYSRMRARCATSSTSAGTRAIFRAHVATLSRQPRRGRSSCGAKCCACATRAATRRWPPSCWRSNWAASRSGSSWGLSRVKAKSQEIYLLFLSHGRRIELVK